MWRLNHDPVADWKAHRGGAVLRMAGWIIGGIALACVVGLVFGWVVKLLWNWIMPGLFGLATITFWQAFGIVILAKILFSGFGHHGDRKSHRFRPKTQEPVEPDVDIPADKKDHYRKFWEEEGRQAFEKYVERQQPYSL